MAPLKSLEKEFPLLDSYFINFCASQYIFSVEDFLLSDLDALYDSANKNPNSEILEKGISQLLSIVEGKHPPLLNGVDLLEDSRRNKHVLFTGCEGIDVLLQGGLREGHLTEIVGHSSSGKTQVCLQAASTVASKHMGRVLYLDTCNSFSPRRIAQFTNQSMGDILSNQDDYITLSKVMNNIICHPVFDIFVMFDVLHHLEKENTLRSQKAEMPVRLLIIDSISSLITPVLGGGSPHGHALMASAGILLKKLAHDHNIAVLVTNHMVAGEKGVTKPALGESWKTIPHVRLLLSRDNGSNIGNISVLKHPSVVLGGAAHFKIYH